MELLSPITMVQLNNGIKRNNFNGKVFQTMSILFKDLHLNFINNALQKLN